MVASDAESDLAALQVTAADLPYLPFGRLGRDRGGTAGQAAGVSVRPTDGGGEAGRLGRDPAGDGDGRVALRRARGRRGRHALPADGRHDAARQQRRADARRGRLRRRRRADEAVARRHERRRRLHGAGEPGQGFPGSERAAGAAAGHEAASRRAPSRSTGSRSPSSCRTGTWTARRRACWPKQASSGRSAFAWTAGRRRGRPRGSRRRCSAGTLCRTSFPQPPRRALVRRSDRRAAVALASGRAASLIGSAAGTDRSGPALSRGVRDRGPRATRRSSPAIWVPPTPSPSTSA